MTFMKRDEDKRLDQYKSLSIRDQAMIMAMSKAIGEEIRAALAEDRAIRSGHRPESQ